MTVSLRALALALALTLPSPAFAAAAAPLETTPIETTPAPPAALPVTAPPIFPADAVSGAPARTPPPPVTTPAEDYTALCTYSGNGTKFKKENVYDGNERTYWRSNKIKNPYLQVDLPEGAQAFGVYISWDGMPARYEIHVRDGDAWTKALDGDARYLQSFTDLSPLGGVTSFRVVNTSAGSEKTTLSIREIRVLGAGVAPDDLPLWRDAGDVDLLVVVASPGDEFHFLGGTVPYYALERQKDVLVASFTSGDEGRVSEMLRALWYCGVKNYPALLGFQTPKSADTIGDTYGAWGREAVNEAMVTLLRKHRPEVVVTLKEGGEYKNGPVATCPDAVLFAVGAAANPVLQPVSYSAYGTWQTPKVYLHQYAEGDAAMRMTWEQPIAALGGMTALDAAKEARAMYYSLRLSKLQVMASGKYDCTAFGLYSSSVGQDVLKDDFFENLDGFVPPPPDAPEKKGGDAAPDGTAGDAATLTPVFIKAEDVMPVPHPAQQSDAVYDFPPLTERGFLPPGEKEFVVEDAENGVWLYASQTLRVRVTRCFDSQKPLTWYEAEIISDVTAGETFRLFQYDDEKPLAKHVKPTTIALKNKAVFAMNGDFYSYRVARKIKVGIVLRDGRIISDATVRSPRETFPPLDTLALYTDGRMGVYRADEYTAQEYLDMGAPNVLSFGPYLIRDGRINAAANEYTKANNPRCGIGMIAPGHYYAVMVEGRLNKISKGSTFAYVTDVLASRGCVCGFNVDGGQTALFTFMGKQITRTGNYTSATVSAPRPLTELLGIGVSELVGAETAQK